MAKLELTSKKVKIDKAQAMVVTTIAAAVFVTVFSLVSVKALWSQRSYQAKIISKKEKARDQLASNKAAVKDLVASYQSFVGAPTNMIDGNPKGSGDKDGDNARIVLDALPSKYDFPALTASLEKILTDRKFKIGGISGTDDEINQSTLSESGSPTPVEIPFQVSVDGSYSSIQDLIKVFEQSIRPFSVQTISLSGDQSTMQAQISLKTYFQPEKTLNIKKEVVKP